MEMIRMELRVRNLAPEEGASSKDEVYTAEIGLEDFASRFAMAIRNRPELLDANGVVRAVDSAPVLAAMLGQDPERFRDEKFQMGHAVYCQPRVFVNEHPNGKIVRVVVGLAGGERAVYFRVSEGGLVHLQCADGWKVDERGASASDATYSSSHPAYPWIAFYPEKFAGLIALVRGLDEGRTRPLTGLVKFSDPAVQTLAYQVAAEIEHAGVRWAEDIVAAL